MTEVWFDNARQLHALTNSELLAQLAALRARNAKLEKVATAAKDLAFAEADAPLAAFKSLPDNHPGWPWLCRTSALARVLAVALAELEGLPE